MLRKIAGNFFEKSGFAKDNIAYAQNGEEALQIFADNKGFDVIYMDHQMPKMTGDVATAKIREYEKQHGLSKAFIFTCSATYQGVFAGADARLTKPFKKESFQQLFATHLNAIEKKEITKAHPLLSASNHVLFSPVTSQTNVNTKPSSAINGAPDAYL